MKTMCYTVQDALGLHARPAGLLARLAKGFPNTAITVAKGGQSARATQLIMLMGLSVKCGDVIEITAEGGQEAEAMQAVETFLREHL